MKKKAKVILTSVLSAGAALALTVGTTVALFTSRSETNIAVTTGKVKVQANTKNVKLYSLLDATQFVDQIVELDEGEKVVATVDGSDYYYEEQSGTSFANSGTAVLTNGDLAIDRMTPGDKVKFDIGFKNTSNVDIKYRLKVECTSSNIKDIEFFNQLEINFSYINAEYSMTGFESYTSNWTLLDVNSLVQEFDMNVEILLPADTDDSFQSMSTGMKFSIEAVQGNANVVNQINASSNQEIKEAYNNKQNSPYNHREYEYIENNTTYRIIEDKSGTWVVDQEKSEGEVTSSPLAWFEDQYNILVYESIIDQATMSIEKNETEHKYRYSFEYQTMKQVVILDQYFNYLQCLQYNNDQLSGGMQNCVYSTVN